MNESISTSAGAAFGQKATPVELETAARAAGRRPAQRTTLYERVQQRDDDDSAVANERMRNADFGSYVHTHARPRSRETPPPREREREIDSREATSLSLALEKELGDSPPKLEFGSLVSQTALYNEKSPGRARGDERPLARAATLVAAAPREPPQLLLGRARASGRRRGRRGRRRDVLSESHHRADLRVLQQVQYFINRVSRRRRRRRRRERARDISYASQEEEEEEESACGIYHTLLKKKKKKKKKRARAGYIIRFSLQRKRVM